jgi:hypothetical protein
MDGREILNCAVERDNLVAVVRNGKGRIYFNFAVEPEKPRRMFAYLCRTVFAEGKVLG